MNLLDRIREFIRAIAMGIAMGVLLGGCTPPAPPFPDADIDDAGDASFVRQVVPVLLGRKVRGYDELTAFIDIIQATDRETLIRALMEQDEFVNYWAEALVDHLRIAREGTKSQSACYGDPLLAGPPTDALADFVLNNVASADFGSAFNLTDLIYSSIKLDNLYPIYKAHVFPLVNRPRAFFGDTAELMRRADLATSFEHVYLNRQQLCMQCHNSEFSTSGEGSGWDRTYPVPGHFEAAIYGSSAGTSPEQSSAIFRTDVRFGSLNPWGLQNTCGTFKPSVVKDPENFTAWFTAPLGRNVSVRNITEIMQFGYVSLDADGLDRSLPPAQVQQCEFCATSCAGVDVSEDAPLNAVNAAAVKTILVDNCATAGCHAVGGGGGNSLDIPTDDTWFNELVNVDAVSAPVAGNQIRVVPGSQADSYLIDKLEGTNIGGSQMPLGAPALAVGEIDTIKNWINDIPSGAACNACTTLDCDPVLPPYVEGHEAVAFLIAQRIVNNVWEQSMGYSLTIANYFSRNEGQLNALWNLTENQFIPSNWSLKELLVKILTSNLFNRNAPVDDAGLTAYDLEMLYDSWVEADPRISPVSDPGYDPADNPQVHNNAMSDGIYRYTAHNLLNSINQALDWPAPERFPPVSDYPDRDLERAIGQYLSDASAGSKTTDFQALLHWESVHGVCDRDSITPAGSDWIDSVMTEVAGFAGGGGPLTMEDLAVLLKDWILADGAIASTAPEGVTDTEIQALEAYFGVSLATQANTVPDLEDKLRGLCGTLIETPQFWLAGLAPTGVGPEPRLRVCNGGPCTYQEICNDLKPAVDSLISGTLTCNAGSINTLGLTARRSIESLCPDGLCGVLPMNTERVKACLVNPSKCPNSAPICDPRCTGLGCCGGPRPPAERQGLLLSWADGAVAENVEGVKILRPGAHRFTALESGERLREGDLLAIRPGDSLRLNTRQGRLETPKLRETKGDERRQKAVPRLMMITGERAIAPLQELKRDREDKKLDREELAEQYSTLFKKHAAGPWRWGEAGRRLTEEQRLGYVGPEEELYEKWLKERQQQERKEQGKSQSATE